LKNLDKISDRDVSHLAYAYGVRNVGNPELHKAFNARIIEMADRLDYPSLFNVIYYLLFKENGDLNLWKRIIQTTNYIEDVLPLVYYRPFKAAAVYLKGRFPELKKDEAFDDFNHKFWYAERYFTPLKQEHYAYEDPAYYQFKGFLNARCFLYPVTFQALQGLFMVHYVFNE
jgi:hypothetical protein